MARRRRHGDDPDLGRWAISWADFLTLLFAFFVVMYGISSVNQEKYRQLAESLNKVFDRETVGGTPASPLDSRAETGSGLLEGGQSLAPSAALFIDAPLAEKIDKLRALKAQFSSELKDLFAEGDVEVSGNDLWIAIEIRSGLLFDAGGAIPAIEADPLIARIAKMLTGGDNPIHVEGYTDNQPIASDDFPSNWELSAARAAAVVRLLEMNGLEPQRMAAVGYGEHRPAYSNRTAEGQRLNRRLVIVIARDERVRNALIATGQSGISEDTVKSLLVPQTSGPEGSLEQIETDSGIIFRRSTIEETQGQ